MTMGYLGEFHVLQINAEISLEICVSERLHVDPCVSVKYPLNKTFDEVRRKKMNQFYLVFFLNITKQKS